MAKRVAGRDLNHQNWDQEEEAETAGQFKKANDKELKGRVIKTARRRNAADGGEKKNVFAGFGGFSSSTPATTNSFSFLAKPEAIDLPKTDANAAVFGSANKTDSASPFLFGSGNAAEPTKPSFGQFSFGKSTKEEKPLSSSFTSLENKSEPKDDLLDKFKAKPGSWSCDVCMISNPADKIKCAACETPKPGAKQPESNSSKASFGDSGGFKFGSGNSGTSPAVFGTKSGETGGTGFGTSFGSSASSVAPTSGFKFGSSAVKDSERESPKPTGGFSFGSAEKSKDTSSSGFVFGAPATEKSTSSVFAFGSNSNPKPASVPAFGTNESSAKSSSFSFGSGSSTPSSEKVSKPVGFAFMSNSKDTTEPKSSKAEFSFGSKSSESGATVNLNGKSSEFGASVSSTPILGSAKSAESSFGNSSSKDNVESNEYNEDYLAHLKALNLQVTEWIKRHVEENPLVLLSPVFLDYEKHLKVISEKYQTKTPAKENSSGTTSFQISPSVKSPVKPSESIKPFSFAASSENKTEPAKFAFGSEAGTKQEPASSGFSFGLASKPAGEGFSFGSGCGGGFGTPAPSQPVSATQLEEDEDSPPVVEVKQVVEDDALYSRKCKLFYKKGDEYMDKGVGMLHLKSADNGKTQLLVRADTNLGNILLNILLNPDIPTTRVGKNNVMLVCVPNPPIDAKNPSSVPVPMLIRVKTGDDADDLKAKIDELKGKK